MKSKLWEHTGDTCIDISRLISALPLSGDPSVTSRLSLKRCQMAHEQPSHDTHSLQSSPTHTSSLPTACHDDYPVETDNPLYTQNLGIEVMTLKWHQSRSEEVIVFPLKSRPPRGRLKQRRSSFRPNCVSGTDRLRHHVSTLHQHLHRKVEKHLDRIWQSEVLQGGGAERFESISTTYSFLLLRNFFILSSFVAITVKMWAINTANHYFLTYFMCKSMKERNGRKPNNAWEGNWSAIWKKLSKI